MKKCTRGAEKCMGGREMHSGGGETYRGTLRNIQEGGTEKRTYFKIGYGQKKHSNMYIDYYQPPRIIMSFIELA